MTPKARHFNKVAKIRPEVIAVRNLYRDFYNFIAMGNFKLAIKLLKKDRV